MSTQLVYLALLTPRLCGRSGTIAIFNDLIVQLRLKPPLEIERRQIQLRQLGGQ